MAFVIPGAVYASGTPTGTEITNQASVSYQDASSNSYSADSNTVTTTVNSVYSVSVSAPADQSGTSSATVYYAYTITNTGNASNTFALSAASGGGGNSWTAALYADDGAGGGTANDGIHQSGETTATSSSGSIAADAAYKFFVAVTIPANTENGQTDDTDLTVTGSGDAGGDDDTSDSVTTTAQAPSLSITKRVRNVTDSGTFNTTATADPDDTLEYQIEVTNSGAVAATSVELTDSDNAYTTYVAESIKIGSSTTCASNTAADDDSTQESGETCSSDTCGQGKAVSGAITAYLGNGATESAGGSLAVSSTVYVCFQVTVD
jgi:uncharacterized repeat protein (TIGR01451 family)